MSMLKYLLKIKSQKSQKLLDLSIVIWQYFHSQRMATTVVCLTSTILGMTIMWCANKNWKLKVKLWWVGAGKCMLHTFSEDT